MTDTTNRFIPFNSDSQCGATNVIFYNKEAPLEDIYNCITGRLQAVINMLVNLYDYQNSDPSTLQALSIMTSYLLNDAYSLLEEFTPQALKARQERGELY